MIFDMRTIYAMTAVACIVLGLIQTGAFLCGRFDRWLGWWGASNLLVGIATFLIALRDQLPDIVTIQFGNALTVVGCLLLPAAMGAFAGRPIRAMPLLALMLLLAAPYLFVLTSHNASIERIVYGSSLFAILDLMVAWQTFCLFREEKLQSARLVAILFVLTALLYGARAVLGLSGQLAERDLFRGGDAVHSWMGLSAMMFIALRSTVIMLMATERTSNALRKAAFVDALTGVLNRGGLLEQFRARAGRSLALLLIDLDHFKQLNDTAGHAAGDLVLKTFAAAARSVVGGCDLIARHGGDEFVVILDQRSATDAAATAERLRLAFSFELSLLPEMLPIRPTLSIGVAAHAGQGCCCLETLLHKADQALYRRKGMGRDGVETYEERSAA